MDLDVVRTQSVKEGKINGLDCSSSLQFAEGIERWRNHPDCPEYLDSLFSTLISDLDSLKHPRKLDLNSPLSDALLAIKISEAVIIDQPIRMNDKLYPCRVLGRLSIVQHSLQAPSLADPIASIIDSVPCLEWVDESDTLDAALRAMVASGCGAVAVASDGACSGVLLLDDILAAATAFDAAAAADAVAVSQSKGSRLFSPRFHWPGAREPAAAAAAAAHPRNESRVVTYRGRNVRLPRVPGKFLRFLASRAAAQREIRAMVALASGRHPNVLGLHAALEHVQDSKFTVRAWERMGGWEGGLDGWKERGRERVG